MNDPEFTPQKTILVVDDDESVRSFLAFSLKSEGFLIEEARDAEKARSLVEKHVPDLILLDIMLPRIDGLTFCKTLRQDPKFNTTPILFITAFGQKDSLEKTKAAGAQGLIEKPITFSELLVQVIDALEGRFSLPTRLKFTV